MLAAAVLRRHLMVWKIFAPRGVQFYTSTLQPVLRIRIRMDPFHFDQADPDPLRWNRIRVAKNQPKSWKISTKIIRISYNFFTTIELMFTDKYLPHKYQNRSYFGEIYPDFRPQHCFPSLRCIYIVDKFTIKLMINLDLARLSAKQLLVSQFIPMRIKVHLNENLS